MGTVATSDGALAARVRAWVLLGLFFYFANTIHAVYWATGLEASAALTLLFKALAIWVFWKVIEAECRPYRVAFPLDMGLFLYGANAIILPYYLWRTQRGRGLLKVALMFGLWIASYATCAAVAWLVVRVRP